MVMAVLITAAVIGAMAGALRAEFIGDMTAGISNSPSTAERIVRGEIPALLSKKAPQSIAGPSAGGERIRGGGVRSLTG
jgi:hypothetical protein